MRGHLAAEVVGAWTRDLRYLAHKAAQSELTVTHGYRWYETPLRRGSCFCTFPPLIPRASPRHLPHAHRMDDQTDDDVPAYDEVLADAIGYIAFTVLDELAADPKARRAFLEGFLSLVEATWLCYRRPARAKTAAPAAATAPTGATAFSAAPRPPAARHFPSTAVRRSERLRLLLHMYRQRFGASQNQLP